MRPAGFNPKARWDRHIPEVADNPDYSSLSEKIEVSAYFKNAKIYPRLFIRKDRIYKIKKVNYNWQERRGQEVINYFSVSTKADLYQISFNNVTFAWRLDKVISS